MCTHIKNDLYALLYGGEEWKHFANNNNDRVKLFKNENRLLLLIFILKCGAASNWTIYLSLSLAFYSMAGPRNIFVSFFSSWSAASTSVNLKLIDICYKFLSHIIPRALNDSCECIEKKKLDQTNQIHIIRAQCTNTLEQKKTQKLYKNWFTGFIGIRRALYPPWPINFQRNFSTNHE